MIINRMNMISMLREFSKFKKATKALAKNESEVILDLRNHCLCVASDNYYMTASCDCQHDKSDVGKFRIDIDYMIAILGRGAKCDDVQIVFKDEKLMLSCVGELFEQASQELPFKKHTNKLDIKSCDDRDESDSCNEFTIATCYFGKRLKQAELCTTSDKYMPTYHHVMIDTTDLAIGTVTLVSTDRHILCEDKVDSIDICNVDSDLFVHYLHKSLIDGIYRSNATMARFSFYKDRWIVMRYNIDDAGFEVGYCSPENTEFEKYKHVFQDAVYSCGIASKPIALHVDKMLKYDKVLYGKSTKRFPAIGIEFNIGSLCVFYADMNRYISVWDKKDPLSAWDSKHPELFACQYQNADLDSLPSIHILNGDYLAKILRVVDFMTGDIEISMPQNFNSPIVFTNTDNARKRCIVMPVRIAETHHRF